MATPSASLDPASRDSRAAVDKAMSLLTAFGNDAHTGVGVSELARRTDLSKSTAFRLLTMLQRNGAVEKVGTAYRLGDRLQLLSASVVTPRHSAIRDALTPFLADLYEQTHSTVHLAVLQGTDVVYLNKLYGHRSVAAPSRIGGRAPAHCTGVGKILMAYDPESYEELVRVGLPALTATTITDPRQLEHELVDARQRGVARDRGEMVPDLTCIAAPVIVRGSPVAALSVSGRSDRFDPDLVEPILRRVCFAASQSMKARRPLSPRPVRLTSVGA